MSRFVLSRKIVTVLSTASILAGSMMAAPQASYADASWADLLKPLVKDVIVPGASMGMKKLMERNAKKNGTAAPSTASTSESSSTSSNDDTSWQDSFSTPQEPTTSASSGDDGISPTPEEPMSFNEPQYSSVALDPASPPPPPVATP
ncbi:MAG: hypothetical protein K0Q50_1927 [Vampirovibrio sp.]|jgi:hypothetical protein|nr:hypothetical protein [Vampirovibrio sp.]